MSETPQARELPRLIEKGLAMVDERSLGSGGAPIYDSIKAQLMFMQNTLLANQQPSEADIDRLLLGVYAVREFETSDPEFADVLFDVEYLFKRWSVAEP